MVPDGHEGPARRYLEAVSALRRLVPGDTRHSPGGLEAATPGDTCPLPGDFATVAFGCWFCIA